jgi:hypothetical protein
MRHKNRWLGFLGGVTFGLLTTHAISASINLVCTRESDKQTIQLVLDESAGTAGFVGEPSSKAGFTASTVKWEVDGSTPNVNWHNTWELNRDNGFLSMNGSTFGGRVITPAYSSATYRCVVAQRLF